MGEQLYVLLSELENGEANDDDNLIQKSYPINYENKTVREIINCCIDKNDMYNPNFSTSDRLIAGNISDIFKKAENDPTYLVGVSAIDSYNNEYPMNLEDALSKYNHAYLEDDPTNNINGKVIDIYVMAVPEGGSYK